MTALEQMSRMSVKIADIAEIYSQSPKLLPGILRVVFTDLRK